MRLVGKGSEIAGVRLQRVEGQPAGEGSTVKELLSGTRGLLAEATVDKAVITPPHAHRHENFCYLIRGRIRVTIGDESSEIGPGDAFLHPAGVLHTSEVLEDSTWIEFKTPPERTWE
ncbi:MAG TPA: cupin domain-containing protein [Anaerolineae bacterium]|nr:cupin domain-containing protein [Anaerolineae bacterium]